MSARGDKKVRANFHQLTATERTATFSLAGIISLRMFGLFMILPVMSLYAGETGMYAGQIAGATAATIGIAISIYGLVQGLLQIPFGLLSDRYGRKPLIIIGLGLFIAGSIIAALSDSIWGIIIGRAIQGGGAIASVVIALTADLTREEVRTKSMAIVGSSIGLAIVLALIIGPVLNQFVGLKGIFWVTTLMATLGLVLIVFVVPSPERVSVHRDAETVPAQLKQVLGNGELLRFDFGIFFLHSIFVAAFIVFPVMFTRLFGIGTHYHGLVYLGVLGFSLFLMVPMIIFAERYRQMKQVYVIAIISLAIVMWGLGQIAGIVELDTKTGVIHIVWMVLLLILFFGAFNFLESALPSLVSKTAPPTSKGTAMGVYSTSQGLGFFVGGAVGGIISQQFGLQSVFIFGSVIALIWFFIAAGMKEPRYLRTQLLNIGRVEAQDARKMVAKLTAVKGVAEVSIDAEEGVAYLKVDSRALDEEALFAYSRSETEKE